MGKMPCLWGGLFRRTPTDLKKPLLWGMTCNEQQLRGKQTLTLKAELNQKRPLPGLQPASQQLELPGYPTPPGYQLQLKAAALTDKPPQKSFCSVVLSQQNSRAELHPCRLSSKPGVTVNGAHLDLRSTMRKKEQT